MRFQAGDPVRLWGAGPRMSVVTIVGLDALVCWYEGADFRSRLAPLTSLSLAPRRYRVWGAE